VRIAAALLAALLAASWPLAERLREDAPPRAEASRLGTGPLLGGVLTGAFRPLLMNYLYIRADILAGQGRFDEQVTLFRGMVQLYPHNEAAREYLGWELAFNSKGEARSKELAWRWAREGLDILADASRETVALWLMTQCGQNAYETYRYAGGAWRDELWMRERAAAWTARRWGRPMHRFDAALFLLPPPDGLFARMARVRALESALIDDWMREGRSGRVEETLRELRWVAGVFEGLEEQRRAAADTANALEAIRGAVFDPADYRHLDERVANALWAHGMHRQDAPMLRQALALFAAAPGFDEECGAIRAWLAWLEGGRKAPRPRHPFDG